MVRIIVVEIGAVEFPFEFKPAACALKSGETIFHGRRSDAEGDRRRCRRQRVADVVLARNVDGHAGEHLAAIENVKLRLCTAAHNAVGIHVRFMTEAERDKRTPQRAQRIHRILIIIVGYDRAGLRHACGKLPEGVLDVVNVLEKVKMIRLDVQYDRRCPHVRHGVQR